MIGEGGRLPNIVERYRSSWRWRWEIENENENEMKMSPFLFLSLLILYVWSVVNVSEVFEENGSAPFLPAFTRDLKDR